MSRKIVFVNQATGYITIDVINAFAREYDEIAVMYGGQIRVQDIPLNRKVQKTKLVRKSRDSNLRRGVRWLIATVQIYFLLLTKYRNYDIFYFSVPPFSYFCSLFLKRKFSIMIFDVYPDVLKNFNVSENNPVYRIWAKVNRKVFSRAHKVFTIGDALKDVISKYVERDKIKVVPLWTGLTNIQPLTKSENKFAIEHKLTEKFVVQYSGNIGQTHNIESLIDVAEELKDHQNIHFLVIGRGSKYDHIKSLILEKDLSNCSIMPFLPDDMIRYSLAVADIGVVVIDDNAAQMSIPSKVYNMMAVGSSLLCIAPRDSELFKMIEKFNNGGIYDKNDIYGMKEFILKLYADRELLEEYRTNSLLASENFKIGNAEKIFNHYKETERVK